MLQTCLPVVPISSVLLWALTTQSIPKWMESCTARTSRHSYIVLRHTPLTTIHLPMRLPSLLHRLSVTISTQAPLCYPMVLQAWTLMPSTMQHCRLLFWVPMLMLWATNAWPTAPTWQKSLFWTMRFLPQLPMPLLALQVLQPTFLIMPKVFIKTIALGVHWPCAHSITRMSKRAFSTTAMWRIPPMAMTRHLSLVLAIIPSILLQMEVCSPV